MKTFVSPSEHTDYGELFDGESYARRSDPETSHSASEEVKGDKANRLELEVLRALKDSSFGLTSHEIVGVTGIPWNTCTPRIRPLVRKGLVRDSGRRRSTVGRPCIVWEAV